MVVKFIPLANEGLAFWLWSKEKVEREKDELKFTKDKTGKWKVYKKVYDLMRLFLHHY